MQPESARERKLALIIISVGQILSVMYIMLADMVASHLKQTSRLKNKDSFWG